MNFSQKIEQLFTHRPNSYVPGKTTAYHFGLDFQRNPDVLNQIHHMGMSIITAPIRAIMSYYGIIGPFASFVFTGIRMGADQLVEQTAGVSNAPWTWPINEQVIDIVHKGFYALIVGYMTDKMVRGVEWFNF